MAERTLQGTLEYWRRERGLSVGKLTHTVGIHRATWARWKKGESLPSARELDAVLKTLAVPPADRRNALRDWDVPRALALLHREHSALPMATGDLLRALRLRAQMTQTEAARQAGVSQGLLTRWENHGAVPDAAKLHALCYVLGASGNEIAAITTGAYRELPPLPDNESERMDAFNTLVHHTETAHKDLLFLSHAAHLIHRFRTGDADKEQMGDVWGRHALHIAGEPGRADDAMCSGKAALSLSNRDGAFNTHIVSGVVALANIAASKFGAAAGIAYLKRWENHVVHPALRQWMTARIADYLAGSGEIIGAVTLIRDVYTTAREQRTDNYGDFLSRRRDYAEMLLRAGDGATALTVLADGTMGGIDGFNPSELSRHAALVSTAGNLSATRKRTPNSPERITQENPRRVCKLTA